MKKLDPDEAPKGYRAREYGTDTNGCDRCAFRLGTDECCSAPCMPSLRRDGRDVYFVPAKPKRPSRTEAAVESVLRHLPADVKIIPGHGPLCGRKEVLRYRDFLKALQAHAAARPGTSSADLAASFDAAAWPEWKPTATFVTWETLFDAVTERGPGRVVRP